ncbi:MAG: sugar ABC transporter ATP-binding protein, partial [Nostoc sp.]
MSQVVLENVYKSFSSRQGESVTSQTQSSLTLGEKIDAAPERAGSVNVLRRINLTIADGEFMVLVGPSG